MQATGQPAIFRLIPCSQRKCEGFLSTGSHFTQNKVFPHTSPPLGGSALRTDSIGKVTGQTRYVEDIPVPGLLHLAVLRSPYHHARLIGLDGSRAAQLPGVCRVMTWLDIPGLNGFPEYSQEEPVLPPVGATLRMRGAPIALVAAETLSQAQTALRAVELDLEPLPYLLEQDEAVQPGAVSIAGDDNLLASYALQRGDLEAAFEDSDFLLDACYETSYLDHVPMERESLLGYIDETGRVTVTGGNHQPHNQQRYLAAVLGLPLEQVRVIVPPTGGSFGKKQDPWPFTAVGLAAYLLRQPVRLVYSRRESLEATPKRHPYQVRYRIGATHSGVLSGIHVRIDGNTGGYDAGGQYIPNYALTAAGGAYRWQAVDGLARTIYTNGPKAGQYRGFGTSQSTFALECTLDELAQKLGLDPLEFRLQNCLRLEDTSFLGYPLPEQLGYPQVLEALRPDYHEFVRQSEEFNSAHPDGLLRRGVGLAGMWYRFGKAGQLIVEAHAELAQDGHFIIYLSAPDYGQGIATTMSQIAADSLHTCRERVELINADTARVPNSDIQGASRATFFVGGAVSKAAEALIQSILGVAAELLDQPVASLVLETDRVVVQNYKRLNISLVEIAQEFDRIGQSRKVAGYFDLSPDFPEETRPEYLPLFITGAQLAEVQVDVETGQVQVLRMVAAHDVGRVINPLDAAGQVQGAIMMGLGAALMEDYHPELTHGLSEYIVPTADCMPEFKVILVEVPSRWGPYGVKGLGEVALLPSTPAIINAISRAIGVRIRAIPATPERVFHAIQGK